MRRQLLVVAALAGLVAGLWRSGSDHRLRSQEPKPAVQTDHSESVAGSAAPVEVPDAPRPEAPSLPAVASRSKADRRSLLIEQVKEFEHWLLALRRQEAPSLARGQQLAAQRRVALKELIALDPQEALARAVPRTLRGQLPEEVQTELEMPVDAFGRFEVVASCFGSASKIERFAAIDDRRYQAYTYGRRLSTLTKNQLAIHGIAIDGQLALSEQPCRPLEPGELDSGGDTAAGVFVAVGDKVQGFVSGESLLAWQRKVSAAESAPDPHADISSESPSAAAAWTLGEKNVLWVRVDYPDDPGSPISNAEIEAIAARIDRGDGVSPRPLQHDTQGRPAVS